MIVPTVGRVVWFKAHKGDSYAGAGEGYQAAIIARVWSDTCVNLMVIDANGNPLSKTSVLLVQDEEPPDCGYCCWMPYQKGQAAKTEALEAAVDRQQAVAK